MLGTVEEKCLVPSTVTVPEVHTQTNPVSESIMLLKKALIKAIIFPIGFGASYLIVHAVAPTPATFEEPSSQPTAETIHRADMLFSQNDCWTGEAPADVLVPSRVIVTRDGHTFMGGTRMVELAFEQVFDNIDHGLKIHAFCR